MEIFKMKDGFDKIKKKHKLFNMPFKGVICSKSQIGMGKSNFIGNLLLRDEGYKNIFEGENIFIVNPSQKLDKKFKVIQEELEIPDENIFNEFDEDVLNDLYEMIEEMALEELDEDGKVKPRLLILDDCSFGGNLTGKRNGVISKIFCNSRHIGLNTILTTQKYTDCPTVSRENLTWLVTGSCSNKQMQLISDDHNLFINDKSFKKMFRDTTGQPYSFLCCAYDRPDNERYLDKNFKIINQEKYL